jgi:hypothetical protein
MILLVVLVVRVVVAVLPMLLKYCCACLSIAHCSRYYTRVSIGFTDNRSAFAADSIQQSDLTF